MIEEIMQSVNELQKHDNEEGYKLDYETARRKLDSVIKELSDYGEECVDYLHPLLDNYFTWSSIFALEVLKNIKSKKSISCFINFIKNSEKGDYGDYCEDAMFALNNIGEPAIDPLIKEIREEFVRKEYYIYLIGSLTEIKSERVYSFMVEIVRDYIKNEGKYGEWFYIDNFVHDFDKQGKKEVLPLLKELIGLDRVSNRERIEIEDTIKIIEDPIAWEKELEADMKRLMPLFEKFTKEEKELPFDKRPKKEQEKIRKMMNKPDDNFALQFKCHECKKKQNVKTGQVWDYGTGNNFSFGNEIMCKFCFSNNIKLTKNGKMDMMRKAMRVYSGKDNGIMHVGKEIIVENKKMLFNKSYSYILRRIEEEPNNGELYLRAGNIAERSNKYNDAIKHYEKSLELNPKLIASYLNLVEIYEHRYMHYKIRDAKQTAIFYLEEMIDLFRTQKFNEATIRNNNEIIQFIGEKSENLGVDIPGLIKVPILPYKRQIEKIGRNDPCHCGSGKKYKKCCLNKDEGLK